MKNTVVDDRSVGVTTRSVSCSLDFNKVTHKERSFLSSISEDAEI